MSSFKREHRLELGVSKFEDLPNGNLLIHNIPFLVEGTWTDSAVGTPLFYPAKTLEKYATNWKDNSGWSLHSGGVPRSITNKVGEAKNLHYSPAERGIVGDAEVFGFTQQGKDAIALIKEGKVNFVSVEHGGQESYNPETKRMEASSLVFSGFAFVTRGACTKCRLNEKGEPIDDEITTDNSSEGMELDTKELEAKYTEQGVELASVKKELEALKAVKSVPMSDFEKVQKELSEALARVKKIEDTPLPTATTVAPTRSLEAPEFVVVHKNGEVYGAGDE